MTWITILFGTVLGYFYEFTGDYGMAIICLTLLARFCLLPFQLMQRKSIETQQASAGSCLFLILQLPIMICLYRSIGMGITRQVGTKLLPWVGSLLMRDPYGVLPVLSVLVQMIPQLFPYIAFFRNLRLPRPAPGMLLSTAVLTALICFPLPAGVGIYYLTSGLFSAAEQGAWNVWKVRRMECQRA